MREFAPNIQQNDQGWYQFPRDTTIRSSLWPEGTSKHPAKYSILLFWAMMQYLTEPGDTILDPMSGTGTSMIAAVEGRKVICIDIEVKYHEMQQKALANLDQLSLGISDSITLLLGDCQDYLPMPVDCIIFSPPYADQLKRLSVSGIAAEEGSSLSELPEYSSNPWNVGNLNYFMYFQKMEKIYALLLKSAPTMGVVLKDCVKGFKRVRLVRDSIKLCEKLGWRLEKEFLLEPQGTEFINIHAAQGHLVVRDESFLVFRR